LATVTLDATTRRHVETLWRFHQMGHALETSDAILVLCSHDTTVADAAARLFLDGWAPLLIFSGGLGAVTRRLWTGPEADRFAAIAAAMGVPGDRILVENRSTNTGENVRFTRQLLAERQLQPASLIVVQKPYMERRAYATVRRVWPEVRVAVTSPRIGLDDYLELAGRGPLSIREVISIMVGDLQRIRLYAERGFQIPQDIPADVWAAFEALVAAGYDSHLVARPSRSGGRSSWGGARFE
jgi:uncharacterized SAM-binding protein YcdF (DUF218 family)